MDSGWAAIIGATIALVGASVVPWIRDARTEAARREIDRRDQLAAALDAVVTAMNEMCKARLIQPASTSPNAARIEAATGLKPNVAAAKGWEMEPHLTHLALLLRTTEKPILTIAQSATAVLMEGIRWEGEGAVQVADSVTIIRAFRSAAAAWYTGEVGSAAVQETYNAAARASLDKILRHAASSPA